jgi:hypothetical protein
VGGDTRFGIGIPAAGCALGGRAVECTYLDWLSILSPVLNSSADAVFAIEPVALNKDIYSVPMRNPTLAIKLAPIGEISNWKADDSHEQGHEDEGNKLLVPSQKWLSCAHDEARIAPRKISSDMGNRPTTRKGWGFRPSLFFNSGRVTFPVRKEPHPLTAGYGPSIRTSAPGSGPSPTAAIALGFGVPNTQTARGLWELTEPFTSPRLTLAGLSFSQLHLELQDPSIVLSKCTSDRWLLLV